MAAFGGAREPFGFLGTQSADEDNRSDETAANCARRQLADRWPYSTLDTRRNGGFSTAGGDRGVDREQKEVETEFDGSSHGGGAWAGRRGGDGGGHTRGGGWRKAFSTGLAIDAAVDANRLMDMERDK